MCGRRRRRHRSKIVVGSYLIRRKGSFCDARDDLEYIPRGIQSSLGVCIQATVSEGRFYLVGDPMRDGLTTGARMQTMAIQSRESQTNPKTAGVPCC